MNDERLLYVLRHAKSSWDNPAMDDHDRPLAPRGLRAVATLASYIAATEIRPELVLCSSARRTRETLEGVGVMGEHQISRHLYEATCGEVIADLRQVPPDTRSVMVIGHNPALQMVVLKLTGGASVDGASNGAVHAQLIEIERKFPTGALAALSFTGPWSELTAGTVHLADYVRPKALQFS